MNSNPGTPSRVRLFVLGCFVLAMSGCVGQVAKTPPPPTGPATVRFGHVFVVVEENANYSDVMGGPSCRI